MPSYVATRPLGTSRRQYEYGDVVDLANLTGSEAMAAIASGALIPARFVATAAQLAAANPIPGAGQVCYATDTRVMRVGDGVTAFSSLPAYRRLDAALTDSANHYLGRTTIAHDGSDTAGWPDRFSFLFIDPTDGETRSGYFNEYGEVRSRAARRTTVALRCQAHASQSGSVNVFEVANSGNSVTYFAVSPAVAAATVPVTAPNIPVDLIRTTDANAINASTVLVSDSVMTVALLAATTYVIEGELFYDCAAAADMKTRFDFTSAPTRSHIAAIAKEATTSTTSTGQGHFGERVHNSNFVAGGAGTGTGNTISLMFSGTVTTNQATTLTIQYAQNTSDATDLVVRAGSRLSYRKAG